MAWMTGATVIGCYTKYESNTTLCEDNKGIFGGWFSRNKIVPKEEKKKEESFSLDFNKIAQFPTGSFWDDLAVTAGQKVRGSASSSKGKGPTIERCIRNTHPCQHRFGSRCKAPSIQDSPLKCHTDSFQAIAQDLQ